MSNSNIFVMIASYCDAELISTIESLFDQARYPTRIYVGVVEQYADTSISFRVARTPHVRIQSLPHAESLGCCWARHIGEKLLLRERYALQIDSHMRFSADWDVVAIDELHAAASSRALLTTRPVPYQPPDQLHAPAYHVLNADGFQAGILGIGAASLAPQEAPPTPQQTALISAGFVFGLADRMREVPYDPYLYFTGEEITMAVRYWTHGWDLYLPNAVIAYHRYLLPGEFAGHFQQHPDANGLQRRSLERQRHLFGVTPSSDPEVLQNLGSYGFGSARSLDRYQTFSGIDFAAQTVAPWAKAGRVNVNFDK